MPSGRGFGRTAGVYDRSGGGPPRGGRAGGRGAYGGGGSWGPQLEDVPGDEEDDFDPDGEEPDGEFDDSSDEEAANDELVLPVALPVCGGPLPPSDEPAKDADEYLRRVQWERMHLSETVDVDVPEVATFKKKQSNSKVSMLTAFNVAEIPEELQHCSEWAEDVVAAFRDLRAKCDDVRRSVEGNEAAENVSVDAWRERCLQERPSTSLLAMQDTVNLHRLIVVVIDGLAEAQDAASDSATGPFGPDSFWAEWVFATLSFVEEPLVDDLQYNLQRLRRTCQKAIVAAHARSEAGGELDSNAHAQATLLLTVVREHFGQR